MTSLADADLSQLVDEWLDWAQAAQVLGVTPAKVRTMVRDHELAAAVSDPGAGLAVPAAFIDDDDGLVVKGLRGLLTVLHDGGYDDRECIAWLFLDADLPGRPIDALRENRGLGGQAACAGHGLLSPPRHAAGCGSASLAVLALAVLTWALNQGAASPAVAATATPTRPTSRPSRCRRCRRRRQHTVALIDAGGPFPYDRDGIVFENREGLLPSEPTGYYHEYTVPTPGASDRGARRIITGSRAVSCTGPTTTTDPSRGSPHERTGRPAGPPRRAGHLPVARRTSRSRTCATPSSTPAGGSPRSTAGTARPRPSSSRRSARRWASPTTTARTSTRSPTASADVTAGDSEGWVLLWDGWGPLAREDERAFSVALSVLGGRVNADKGGRFAVLLRGDGPDVDGVPWLD